MIPTLESPKRESAAPKREIQALELPPVRDLGIRLTMIPAFGIAIPNLVGLLGQYGPRTAMYWLGIGWSILISFTIWHGNRYFLLRQRRHYDWFQHPARKICVLLCANVFYTAPVSVLMLLAWYRFAGFGPDWFAIRTATLCCVVCVVFITHVYETAYLIQQRESDLLAVERLRRVGMEAELQALKTQVAPHFLFNSLNTLGWLIENDKSRALAFNQDLAEVYRYILVANRRELVPLDEEFDFVRRYFRLLQLRFDDSLELHFPRAQAGPGVWFLPPVSLQTLIENAVKHNEHSRHHPLRLRMEFEGDHVVVRHVKRPMPGSRPTSRVGLKSLDDRCRLALGQGIDVLESGGDFIVRVPLRSVPA